MPGQAHDTTSRPVISAIAAELFVADIKASCDFFTQKLGFSIVFHLWGTAILCPGEEGQGPAQSQMRRLSGDRSRAQGSGEPAVSRHGCRYARRDQAAVPGISSGRHHLLSDAEEGAWGATTFIVKDPDGNLLL